MFNHVSPVCRARARHDRHPASNSINNDLQQRRTLCSIQSLNLTGKTREHHTIHAFFEREDHQSLHTRLVNTAIRQKRRWQNGQNSLQASHHLTPPN
jgi:hypothetical protein